MVDIRAKQINALKSDGYFSGSAEDVRITSDDIDIFRELAREQSDEACYGELFHRVRKKWTSVVSDSDVFDERREYDDTQQKIYKSNIVRKATQVLKDAGHDTSLMFLRTSQYLPNVTHSSDNQYVLGTSVHRDDWRDVKIGSIFLIVIEQKGILSNMQIIRTDRESSPYVTYDQLTAGAQMKGCKILANLQGEIGTIYAIDQKNHEDLYHKVTMKVDKDMKDAERLVFVVCPITYITEIEYIAMDYKTPSTSEIAYKQRTRYRRIEEERKRRLEEERLRKERLHKQLQEYQEFMRKRREEQDAQRRRQESQSDKTDEDIENSEPWHGVSALKTVVLLTSLLSGAYFVRRAIKRKE